MNNIHIPELLRENFTTLGVQLNPSNHTLYTYKVLKSEVENYKIGDLVLVPRPKVESKTKASLAQNRVNSSIYQANISPEEAVALMQQEADEYVPTFPAIKVGMIGRIHEAPEIDYDSTFEYKWVIQKLSMAQHDSLVDEDAELMKKFKELQEERNRKTVKEAMLLNFPELTTLMLK